MTTQGGRGPDVGDLLGGGAPRRRITSPGADGQIPAPGPVASVPGPVDLGPDPDGRRRGVPRAGPAQLVAGVVVLAVVAGFGGWFGWRQLRGVPAELSVAGAPVVNAEALLADGADAMRRVVAVDGGTVPDGAGCWFAPRAAERPSIAGPRLACGPVRLGVAGDDERWLVAEPRWSTGTGGDGSPRATGVLEGFSGVAGVREHLLRRPDGARPPAGEPTLGTTALRAEDGRVVTGAAGLLAQVDRSFATAARTSGAAVPDDARCWLAARAATRAGVTVQVFTGRVWCGPVLLPDSPPEEFWTTVPVSLGAGGTLVEAVLREPSFERVDDTGTPREGTLLHRPDGAVAPTSVGDLLPPPGDPVAPGTVRVLAQLPPHPALDLVAPADGRLVTPAAATRITGFARAPRLGDGAGSIAAPPGEELVVATFAVTRPDDAPRARGVATVVADGVRLAVPGFDELVDGGAVVASVPQGAQDVVLEVLFEDRVQRVSLVTGERAPGAPAVLYRGRTSVGVGAPLALEVPLPAGPAAGASAAVAEAALSAWHPDRGWADDGRAYLAVRLTDWSLVEPCCDVRGLDVTAAWSLQQGDAVHPVLEADAGRGDVTLLFVVPEDLTAVDLVLDLTATFEGGPTSARTTAPLELPR